MSLPPIDPAVTAEAVAALPARLRKRLDEVLPQVSAWPVGSGDGSVTVRPDDKTTVTLRVPVTTPEEATCDCLLAPRCLHRAAVLSAAPILTAQPEPPNIPADPGPPETLASVTPPGPAAVQLTVTPPESTTAQVTAAPPQPTTAQVTATSPQPTTAQVNATPQQPTTAQATATSPQPTTAQATATPQQPTTAQVTAAPPKPTTAQVTAAQRSAAGDLWAAGAAVLVNGVSGTGAVAQADLLRAVHQARATGLHGPAASAIRVVERLRNGRREDPAFRLADLTDDLRELLSSCHRLMSGDSSVAGVARRDYEPVGDLRLFGLFCEPVRAATGHAGAATYLADGKGRLWLISDVRPAVEPATAAAVRSSVDLGEVRLSHHALARAGLRTVNAHASATGRLSHGRARQAVSASGTGWFDPPLDQLWQADPGDQATRWLAATALPTHERPAPHDLAFLEGIIIGADQRGLLLAINRHHPAPATDRHAPADRHDPPPTTDRHNPAPATGRHDPTDRHDPPPTTDRHNPAPAAGRHHLVVVVSAPHEDRALPYINNLRLLATHGVRQRIRLIGRFTGPRRVDGLAFAAPWLPVGHGGHVDLGATVLARADLADHSARSPLDDADRSARSPMDGADSSFRTPMDEASRSPRSPMDGAGSSFRTPMDEAGRSPRSPMDGASRSPQSPTNGADRSSGPVADGDSHGATPDEPGGDGTDYQALPGSWAASVGGDPAGITAPPLHLLRHQVERVVAAGRAVLLSGVGDDTRRLAAAHLGTASAVLTGLGAAGTRRTRDVFGRLDPHDAHHFARAWLTAAVYEHAATQEATRLAWTQQ
ncbi:SWIM zinc finger family protein [Actinoplanes regularis]|uniref:SWIM zinc finger family protein n=1 Tax=Actinoplanes regularis TaxID=52697 RepID=UPI0024A4D968|nr:SWIM zinc finger family protein [Actinoplanes regularis]GLW27510.1 hypothetical protein Areg01_04510 [Actinoplanes regularis]